MYRKRCKKIAIDLGIAMQLTNIARDVLEDAKIGRRYLPVSKNLNISAQEIRDIAENIKLNFKKINSLYKIKNYLAF